MTPAELDRRERLDLDDVGPFAWRDGGVVCRIARDPGVPMSAGYVGRFLWSVTWPIVQVPVQAGDRTVHVPRPSQSRHGTATSLVAAEQAIAGARAQGRPPWAPPGGTAQ
jgi:hypothetical protein